ncbi:hypothetical protein ACFHYN_04755 [Pasteurella multocida]
MNKKQILTKVVWCISYLYFWISLLLLIFKLSFPSQFVDTQKMNEKDKFQHLTGLSGESYEWIKTLDTQKELNIEQNK